MANACPIFVHSWWQLHPPVGVLITLLAIVSVVPWLREKATRREKAFWMALMCLFVAGELRTIYLERQESARAQQRAECEQLQRFGQIAEGVREDLKAITGADSYPRFLTVWIRGQKDVFPLYLEIRGKYPVKGMSAEVIKLPPGQMDETYYRQHLQNIPIAESDTTPGVLHQLNFGLTEGTYRFHMFTLGGTFTEILEISTDPNGRHNQTIKVYGDRGQIEPSN